MPRKQEWTVRVINHMPTRPLENTNLLPALWIEQLRYMGMARMLAEHDNRNVVEFYAPKGHDSKIWADQNAARMRSFGIDAAAAPKWMDDMYSRPVGAASNDTEHMERLNKPKR